jgi:hypothetical protein
VRAERRHDRTTLKLDREPWPHLRLVRELPRPPEEQLDSAPPPESALSRELDADVMQTTPMRGAARCDVFFVRVDPYFLVSCVGPTCRFSRGGPRSRPPPTAASGCWAAV